MVNKMVYKYNKKNKKTIKRITKRGGTKKRKRESEVRSQSRSMSIERDTIHEVEECEKKIKKLNENLAELRNEIYDLNEYLRECNEVRRQFITRDIIESRDIPRVEAMMARTSSPIYIDDAIELERAPRYW
jgi:vacuolar-type H+-ATPase subunit I/STV1